MEIRTSPDLAFDPFGGDDVEDAPPTTQVAPQSEVQPEARVDQGPVPYQEVLRALGLMLDEDKAARISMVEVEGGFLLRRQRLRHTMTELGLTHIERRLLEHKAAEMRVTRPRVNRGRHVGFWSHFPVTHQDFFRALGYELDSIAARAIVVDELPHGLLLAFEQGQRDGGGTRMRRLVLGQEEIEEILNDAVRRRGTGATRAVSLPDDPDSGVLSEIATLNRDTSWSTPRIAIPYEQELRNVGKFLDRMGAGRVCVLEAPDGLAVRFRLPDKDELLWTRFTDDQPPIEGPANRKKLASMLGWSRPPGGYTDLFRAIGYELERRNGSGILITEQEGGFILAFQYFNLQRSTTSERAVLFLDPQKQEEIRERARGRRKSGSRPRS